MEYERMNEEPETELPDRFTKLHQILKALAQVQVFLGLITFTLGALEETTVLGPTSDIWRRIQDMVPEICGVYFIVTGFIGICGAASYRRGLTVTFLVMCVHIAAVGVPAILITSLREVLLSLESDCYSICGGELREKCKIECGSDVRAAYKAIGRYVTPVDLDIRIDVALICLAALEFVLAVVTGVLCCRGLCEACGLVDHSLIEKITKMTAKKRVAPRFLEVPTASSEISVDIS